MKNLSNNSFLQIVINLLFLTLLAKLLAVLLLWFLPSKTEELQENDTKTFAYRSVNFGHLLDTPSHTKSVRHQPQPETSSIKDMVLHGLYGNSKYGYAIVATRSNPKKTEIISIGEEYRGYKLKRIALNYVVFTKNNREYILELDTATAPMVKSSVHRVTASRGDREAEDIHTVSRSEINYYVRNPSRIWHDIAIEELKSGGKITGFKVMNVRKNSKIAALGLQRGDIIIRANGMALTSYREAVKIYQNLKKLTTISLVVKRGNEEKELIYEIN